MEELWKDMSLCTTPPALQSHHLHSPAAAPYRGAAHFQVYLGGAVPQPTRTPPPHTALTLEFTCPGRPALPTWPPDPAMTQLAVTLAFPRPKAPAREPLCSQWRAATGGSAG